MFLWEALGCSASQPSIVQSKVAIGFSMPVDPEGAVEQSHRWQRRGVKSGFPHRGKNAVRKKPQTSAASLLHSYLTPVVDIHPSLAGLPTQLATIQHVPRIAGIREIRVIRC